MGTALRIKAGAAAVAVGGMVAAVLWGVSGAHEGSRDRFPSDFATGQPPAAVAPQGGGFESAPGATPAPIAAYTGTGASSADRADVDFRRRHMQQLLSIDDIRPIYEPEHVRPSETHLDDRDYVLALSVNGDARAYPVDVLNFREMVNDVVGGVPVLITW